MQITAFISATLHIAVFVIAWIGVIPMSRPDITQVRVIDVEVMTELEKPAPKSKPVAKQKPKPPPPPPPRREPPPKPQVVEKPEAVPTPKPPPDVPPVPKPKPKPKAKKPPKEKPKKFVQRPRPKSKPKPPPPKHDFSSVLKTVKKLERKPPPPKPKKRAPKKPKKNVSPLQQVADALKRAKPTLASTGKLTKSELSAIEGQFIPCWSPPVGAQGAEAMIVWIRAILSPDGTVRTAEIMEKSRMNSDPFFRAMAESARRAVRDPRCQPLRLPFAKYEEWRDLVVSFDPREMY